MVLVLWFVRSSSERVNVKLAIHPHLCHVSIHLGSIAQRCDRGGSGNVGDAAAVGVFGAGYDVGLHVLPYAPYARVYGLTDYGHASSKGVHPPLRSPNPYPPFPYPLLPPAPYTPPLRSPNPYPPSRTPYYPPAPHE